MQIYRSAIFHCIEDYRGVQGQYFSDGLLIIENGKVLSVGHYDEISSQFSEDILNTQVITFSNRLIIPGLIDTHIHYPQYKIIASFGKTLLQWLNEYTFVEEQKFQQETYAYEVANLFFPELLRHGTTTAMSFCTSHSESVDAFFHTAGRYGMRMLGGKVMMDSNAPDNLCDSTEDSYHQSRQLIEKWHNKGRLIYSVSPRFALTCSSKQLTLAARLMQEYDGGEHPQEGVRLQTHLNENKEEIQMTHQLYPDYDNYFDIYDKHGLAGVNSVFGHCIYGEKEEFRRLCDSGSKVALCPRSNLFLGSGLFDIQTLNAYHIDFALASDVGGGDSFSLFKVMNEAYKIAALQGYTLDSINAFYSCTLGAAKVLNLAHCLGNFEQGKEADFVVLDLQAMPLLMTRMKDEDGIDDLLFSIICLGDDRLVDEVYLLGKKVQL